MAREKRELTINELLELNWDDGKYTNRDEEFLIREFELGWDDLTVKLKAIGHDKLLFNPLGLVI